MPSLLDQLFDTQALLRKAEEAGDDAGAEILHQRIAHLEAQIHDRP